MSLQYFQKKSKEDDFFSFLKLVKANWKLMKQNSVYLLEKNYQKICIFQKIYYTTNS